MKKIATNMTMGQILFILFILLAASVIFFTLGAKVGGDLMTLAETDATPAHENFLPDDRLAAEIEDLLSQHNNKFVFHDIVDGGKQVAGIVKEKKQALSIAQTLAVSPEELQKKLEEDAQLAKKNQSEKAVEEMTLKLEPKKLEKKEDPFLAQTDVIEIAPASAAVVVEPEIKPQIEEIKESVKELPQATEVVKNPDPSRYVTIPPQPLAPEKTIPKFKDVSQTKDSFPPVEQQASASYRLQLGSYAERSRAELAAQQWRQRGYSARIVESKIPGKGIWYRLNLGSYNNRFDAESHQRSITQKYGQSAMILGE